MRARLQSDYEKDGEKKLKGKGGDTMSSMFDKRGNAQESFQKQMTLTLDNNKKKYDRQLYSDWVTKVYNTCSSVCIKNDANNLAELREVEKICGKNCIRKYDKIYKLFDKIEGKILTAYCDDSGIDTDKFI